jgi:broad-specificity NMP kinase
MADKHLSIKDEDTYDELRKKGYSKEKAARIANAQAAGTIDHHKGEPRKGKRAKP